MDTGIPLFFSEIEYLLLETIPLETIMRVIRITYIISRYINKSHLIFHYCSENILNDTASLVKKMSFEDPSSVSNMCVGGIMVKTVHTFVFFFE